jgi:hypothetical protein
MLRVAPTRDDLVAEFGRGGLKQEPGKPWTYDIPKEKGKRFLEMMSPYRRAERQRATAIGESFEAVEVRDHRGRRAQVRMTYPEREARLAARGRIRAYTRHGKYVMLASSPHGDFCEDCGRRLVWCECEEG